jgi:hypothetical protein
MDAYVARSGIVVSVVGMIAVGPNGAQAMKQVTITQGELKIGTKAFALHQGVQVDAEAEAPNYRAVFALIAGGVLGIPGALYFNAVTPQDFTWLVLFPVAVLLGSIYRLITAEDRYWLVLRTGGHIARVFSSEDPQLVIALVARARDARRR